MMIRLFVFVFRYEIKVCAFTAVGDGPYTQIIEVKTNREGQ